MEKTLNSLKKRLQKAELIGLDTCCFIYKFEEHPQFEAPASVIFDSLDTNRLQAVTSIITAAEILTKPYQNKNWDVVDLYETVLFELPNFSLLGISYNESKKAAELRAEYKIALPDAFQIAVSLSAGASVFVTNDEKLRKIKELEVIILKDYTNK